MSLFLKKVLEHFKKTPLVFKLFIAIILCLRIVLLTQPSFKIDMGDWQAWSARLVDVGPFNFYSANFFADYFPFFYLSLFIFAKIYVLIFGKAAIFSMGFEIYLKVISNIFDFSTALIIFKIINKHSKKWSFLGSIFYLLNPSVIFNSTVWGQIDTIPTFLIIFSLYQLEEKKNIVMSVLANVLSFLIKPFNVAIFPLVLYRIIKNFSLQKILKAIAVSLLAFFVITIPFFPKDPLLGAFNHFFGSLDVYPYTSINAYNFWGLFGWWRSDATLVLNLSNHIWGLILYALVLCIIFVPYFAKKGRIEAPFDYFACALSSLGFFLFVTRMHERHLFPAFALLIVSACIFRSRVLIFSYIVLAVINFINLFYSYYYYNVAFNNPLASKNILFDISSNYRLFFSISSLVIFVVMLVTYFLKARISSRKL